MPESRTAVNMMILHVTQTHINCSVVSTIEKEAKREKYVIQSPHRIVPLGAIRGNKLHEGARRHKGVQDVV